MSSRILVTGGSGSGKSAYAERRLTDEPTVTYVAPGRPADGSDPEWAARVAAHQQRRPASWTTVETVDVAAALREASAAVLVDCLGTWLTGLIDGFGTWDVPLADWQHRFDTATDELVQSWLTATGPAVAVTNEVGWGLVSEHRSGRLFTQLLGRVNVAMAQASDEVVLVVAGRALVL